MSQEATAWAEEKTTSRSKANLSEVVPLGEETLPTLCHRSKLTSLIVCCKKSTEGGTGLSMKRQSENPVYAQ